MKIVADILFALIICACIYTVIYGIYLIVIDWVYIHKNKKTSENFRFSEKFCIFVKMAVEKYCH